MCWVWTIIRQNFLGKYIISLFDCNRPTWIQEVIGEKEFKIQHVRETSMFILPHKTFWNFCQSGTLPGNLNMKVSPDIWNINTFWTTSLYALVVHRQLKRQKLYIIIGYSTVKLKLKSLKQSQSFQWFWIICEIGTFEK